MFILLCFLFLLIFMKCELRKIAKISGKGSKTEVASLVVTFATSVSDLN